MIDPSALRTAKAYSTSSAFAALKADGSITAWGDSDWGGTGAPSDNGYTKIYSNQHAFAALKADGSIVAWGGDYGGSGAPSGSGYTKIYSTSDAFAVLKALNKYWYSHYQKVHLCLHNPKHPTP
jgi:alpha-tubulin suppressor-like RCC1 family protein